MASGPDIWQRASTAWHCPLREIARAGKAPGIAHPYDKRCHASTSSSPKLVDRRKIRPTRFEQNATPADLVSNSNITAHPHTKPSAIIDPDTQTYVHSPSPSH